MPYQSFDEILRDRRLLVQTDDQTPAGMKRAIEERLTTLQPDGVTETTEEYRLLVEARELLENYANRDHTASTAIVPITSVALEKLINALDRRPESAELSRDQKKAQAVAEQRQVEVRMRDSASAAVTKASQDFRHSRTLPFAGIGTIAAAAWASRAT